MVATENRVGFGCSVPRFGKITLHPSLDPNGLYAERPNGCDPCLYSPQPLHKIFEVNKNRKIEKDPWRYKNELEEWAQNLGYRNSAVLSERRWRQSVLGPAWHDVGTLPKYQSACPNVGFGRTSRSKQRLQNNNPGPGTYYKPVPFKAPYGPHSTLPSFEREEACRFKDDGNKCSLAPNRYRIIDKASIEEKPKKIVSLRGPYDLFTGKRDGTSIKNHFNISLRCSAATWPLALKGSFETYKKTHLGELNKSNRSAPYRGRNALVDLAMRHQRPEDPGPAHYNVHAPRVFAKNKYGFNSSYDQPPGYQRVVVWPGVGRYSLKGPTCGILGQGHKHVFLSKLGRTIGAYIPEPMNTF